MKEGIEFNGTFGTRLQKLISIFENNIAIKRIYVNSDGKINMTLLFNGTDEDSDKLRIFLKSHMPTEDNCTVFIKNNDPSKDYIWKIELIDVMVSR